MNLFPFPDRIQSREELKKDVLYNKIPEEDRVHICEMAWIRGVSTAQKILNKFPKQNIHQILTGERVKITTVSKDEVCGNIRIFGEFYSTKKEIVIYTESIAKWASANQLENRTAEELVLAHEFFHYLECTEIGDTSKEYQVPAFRIGKITIGKSGVRTLSEIAAHGL